MFFFPLFFIGGALATTRWQQLSQPLWHPPRGLAHEEHGGRDQRHADKEGIEKDRDGEREAEDLNKWQRLVNECYENRNHNDRSGCHHARTLGKADDG